MGLDGEADQPKVGVEVELPDRTVPQRRTALDQLAAPDVVDEDVDMTVVAPMRVARSATCRRSRWSTTSGIPLPPSSVTSAAVSSTISGRSYSERTVAVVRPVHTTVAPASPSAAATPRPAPACRPGDHRGRAPRQRVGIRPPVHWPRLFGSSPDEDGADSDQRRIAWTTSRPRTRAAPATSTRLPVSRANRLACGLARRFMRARARSLFRSATRSSGRRGLRAPRACLQLVVHLFDVVTEPADLVPQLAFRRDLSHSTSSLSVRTVSSGGFT